VLGEGKKGQDNCLVVASTSVMGRRADGAALASNVVGVLAVDSGAKDGVGFESAVLADKGGAVVARLDGGAARDVGSVTVVGVLARAERFLPVAVSPRLPCATTERRHRVRIRA